MTSASAIPASLLCVDTDPAVARDIAGFLPACETVSALDGYNALREINSRTFDLYVLDFWLPDWTGLQLCREIRKNDPHAPVFFCTNAARDEDRKRALRAGANAYLTKPLDPRLFAHHVRSALELTELESVRAKAEEERAIHEELVRLAGLATARAMDAREVMAQAMRRTARSRAFKAFVEAGGTRANFDRWWP